VLENTYCTRKCFGEADAARPRPVREAHARWVGATPTKRTGRARANQWFAPRPCAVCGEAPVIGKRNVHRHHKDGNPRNNDESNIAFLCRTHHVAAHRAMKRRET
jgi:hypothetical protein